MPAILKNDFNDKFLKIKDYFTRQLTSIEDIIGSEEIFLLKKYHPDFFLEIEKFVLLLRSLNAQTKQQPNKGIYAQPFYGLYIQNLRTFCEFCLRYMVIMANYNFKTSSSENLNKDTKTIFIKSLENIMGEVESSTQANNFDELTLDKLLRLFDTPFKGREFENLNLCNGIGFREIATAYFDHYIDYEILNYLKDFRKDSSDIKGRYLRYSDSIIHGNYWRAVKKGQFYEDISENKANLVNEHSEVLTTVSNILYPLYFLNNEIGATALERNRDQEIEAMIYPACIFLTIADLFAEKTDLYFIPLRDLS